MLNPISPSFAFPLQKKKLTTSLIRTAFICSVTVIPVHFVHAADAGSLLLEQQQSTLPPLELPTETKEDERQPAEIAEESGQTIVIQNLLFTGKIDFLSDDLQTQFITSVKGKSLGIQGITQLTNQITTALQQQGHLLAQATLPAQDITEGTLTINIMDGQLSKIQLNYTNQEYITIMKALFKEAKFDRSSSVRANEERLTSIITDHISRENVIKSDLEEALLRINDHPGVNAKSRLTQGKEANTSDLIIEVKQQPVFTASTSVDNFGSYSTGKEQVRAEASITDKTGYGDVTQFSLVASEGQTFARGAFSLPVNTTDFTAKASYSFLDYQNIDDTGSALDLEGNAHFLNVGLDYNFIRSRNLNVRVNAGVNLKTLLDDSAFGELQDKQIVSTDLGLSGDMRDAYMGGGATYWSANWTYGYLDLSGVESALETDQLGLKTDGQFHHLNVSLARVQNLPKTFSLFGRVYGQWANKNLDSAEGFTLGGSTGVRGWPTGEANGDMGALGTVELRYDVPLSTSLGKIQLATFIDTGHIWLNQDASSVSNTNACDCNDYSLTSAGVSARWDNQYFTLLASYAQGLGDNPGRTESTDLNTDNTDDNYQVWLSATARF